jgi:hypothetical protein
VTVPEHQVAIPAEHDQIALFVAQIRPDRLRNDVVAIEPDPPPRAVAPRAFLHRKLLVPPPQNQQQQRDIGKQARESFHASPDVSHRGTEFTEM